MTLEAFTEAQRIDFARYVESAKIGHEPPRFPPPGAPTMHYVFPDGRKAMMVLYGDGRVSMSCADPVKW